MPIVLARGFGDAAWWTGFAWALVLVAALVVVFAWVVVLFRRDRRRASFLLVSVLPALLPLLIYFGLSQAILTTGLMAIGLHAWPAILFGAALIEFRAAKGRCYDLIEEHKNIEHVIGRDAEGLREEEIRQNDGYCRACYPEFRHWSPKLTGEAGYFTWIGGLNDEVLSGENFSGESVVFRTTSLAANPLARTEDRAGPGTR